jgi:hypothetical protein
MVGRRTPCAPLSLAPQRGEGSRVRGIFRIPHHAPHITLNMSFTTALLLDPHAFHVWIAYRTDGIRGSGTQNDPYNGSTQALFDSIMANLPDSQPLCIHLGPSSATKPFVTGGFFLTSEAEPVPGAWQPKPRMAILGSGIDVTWLQLNASTATSNTHYFAIGSATTNCVDFFEVSGLTIDCNLPSDRTVACGAVRVMGNHVRVRDVKCINWGSRSTLQPGFVIALLIADPEDDSPWLAVDNAGIENCIAIEPSPYNDEVNATVSVLHVGGRELGSSGIVTQFGKGPFIRNCFVDAESEDELSSEFRALSMGGCHGGIVEGNQIHNVEIGGPYQDTINTREIIVRNNTYRNVVRGPYWNLNRSGSNILSAPASVNREVTITMPKGLAHGLSIGNEVTLVTQLGTPPSFTGTFEIISVPRSDQFTVENPTAETLGYIKDIQYSTGHLLWATAVRVNATSTLTVTMPLGLAHGLQNGDAVTLTDTDPLTFTGPFVVSSVPPADDQFTVSNAGPNASGVIANIFKGATSLLPSAIASRPLRQATITMPSSQAHGLNVGDRIELISATPSFNGLFEVTTVPLPDRFTITAPGPDISGSVTSIRKLVGVEKLLIHNNTFELAPASLEVSPVGIEINDTGSAPAPHWQVVIRNNRFWSTEGLIGAFTGVAIHVAGAKAAIISGNMVDAPSPNESMTVTERCASVSASDNRSFDGGTLEPSADRFAMQLGMPSEDSVVTASFKK